METRSPLGKRVLVLLGKDFSHPHTITSLARELGISRVGMWKALQKLKSQGYVSLDAVGSGKTSTHMITMRWDNILTEKALSLYLTEEALKQRRWRVNFAELEHEVDFAILFGSILHIPEQANDIDLVIGAEKNKFVDIQETIDAVQKTQTKSIHAISFTKAECRQELMKPNKALREAITKGVILFGQDNFVRFMKEMAK